MGRGDRLVHDEYLYSGAVWHGERALELGLIDGLGSLHSVARDQLGESNRLWYSPDKSPLEEIMGQLTAQTKTAIAWGLSQSLVVH